MNQQPQSAVQPKKGMGCFSKFVLTIVGFAAAIVAMVGFFNMGVSFAQGYLQANPQILQMAADWVVNPAAVLPKVVGGLVALLIFLFVSLIVSRIP